MSPLDWISQKNPYLAFRLLSINDSPHHFPKVRISIRDDCEVLFIEGVTRCFESIAPFLERGGKLYFIERDVTRVAAFLTLSDLLLHSNLEIILDDQIEYQKIAKSVAFKKQQFIGKLKDFRVYMDDVHLALSEYADLGKTIIRNIQGNLLQTRSFVHGKDIKGMCKSSPVIICGSGPSLEANIEKIINSQNDALIFAAGSAIPKLIAAGVKIDAGFFVDPWPPVEMYECLKKVAFPLFYQNRMSEELFQMHVGPKIWMGSAAGWELEEWIYAQIGLEPFFFDAGWNAGTFAYQCAKYLDCGAITLFGMDGGDRRDLERGAALMDDLHAEVLPKVSFSFDKLTQIDTDLVRNIIIQINQPDLRLKIDQFLEKKECSPREMVLLEADLMGEPLYDYLIEPLWKVLGPFYKKEGADAREEMVAKVLFSRRVLQFQQKFRFYPTGALYSKETNDGMSMLFYETGELKAKVCYQNGVLNGEFSLFDQSGLPLRRGHYKEGKREGVHVVYEESGEQFIWA